MTLQDRVDSARAKSYEAENKLRDLSRKMSDLRKESCQQQEDLRIAQMNHWILIAEIKKNTLLGELYGSASRCDKSETRPYGLSIQ